ncbi:GNAT family N-acetyltransferase [Hwanghaeella grinnelliae]|nr:GNAT family N-acetyltransferase [Hwanghaeella grinnelliae]
MTINTPIVRTASAKDIEAMGKLFEAAFDEPYGAAAIADLLKPPSAWALIAETSDPEGILPVGFLIGSTAADEAEILSLGVSPGYRRKRVGVALLNFMVHHAKSKGAEKFFLEVAADNAAAIALYGAAGFKRVGLRRNYYKRRGGIFVDALILRRDSI